MIPSITFSKKIRSSAGTLVVSIPPEIVEDMELSDSEMVEVRLTKKLRVDPASINIPANIHAAIVLTDDGVWRTFR